MLQQFVSTLTGRGVLVADVAGSFETALNTILRQGLFEDPLPRAQPRPIVGWNADCTRQVMPIVGHDMAA